MLGLVLSGGGARAAYQAGALRALAELSTRKPIPFPILTGVSAGAINAAYLACHADDFRAATAKLWRMWETLSENQVFRVNRRVAPLIGTRWLADVLLHRMPAASGPKPRFLLDTKPLLELLRSNLDFKATREHFKSGDLHGVAFSATNYDTGTAVTFFDGHRSIQPWLRCTRLGVREKLSADQVVASTAMPIFFPPVKIDGCYYGDGCIRMTSPLSPALHLGADRLLAIGTHSARRPKAARAIVAGKAPHDPCVKPSLADVFGVIISAVFLDALELDIERLLRINESVRTSPKPLRRSRTERLSYISVQMIQPVQDLGAIAAGVRPPLPFQHLLYALGAATDKTSDILSFLAFERNYTSRLLELGYHDAMHRKVELERFLRAA
jgi:NTE family protein